MHTEEERQQFLAAIKANVDGGEQEYEPTIFCDFNQGEMVSSPIPLNGPQDKDIMVEMIYRLIRQERLTWFALVLESWMCTIPHKEADYEEIMKLPAPLRPGAQEVVLVTISNSKQQHNWMGMLEKVRGKRYIKEWKAMPDSMAQGRFVDLWKKAKAVTN